MLYNLYIVLDHLNGCRYQPTFSQAMLLPEYASDTLLYKQQRDAVLQRISPREMQFLQWVIHHDELTYTQIADKMAVSFNTVDKYRRCLCRKFAICSKAGLVIFARTWGIDQAGVPLVLPRTPADPRTEPML